MALQRFGSQAQGRRGPWPEAPVESVSASAVREFVAGVYRWMAVALALTAATAWYVAHTPTIFNAIVGNQLLFFGLIAAELGVVLWLSFGINRMNATTATGAFIGYSVLTGLTFSVIFAAYTPASIFKTFIVTSGMFGGMALYGTTTKKDLTGWGSFLFMGLIGIILAMVVNIFLQSSMLDWVVSAIGVVVFTGLAAYDAQQVQRMGAALGSRGEAAAKGQIMGALRLYLDFINLFIMLLRFMGERR